MEGRQPGLARHLSRGTPPDEKRVGIRRLAFQSLGELWLFQMLTKVTLAALLGVTGFAARSILASKGMVLTTANIRSVFSGWQGPALCVVGLLAMCLCIAVDLFAHLYFCDDLMRGSRGGVTRRTVVAIRKALCALPRFFTPSGLPTLLYVFLLVPLVGVGFSVGLTHDLYVPRFIMDVVHRTPLYAVIYAVTMLVLGIVGVLHFFTLHGVLLDGLSPREARRTSRLLVGSHPWRLVGTLLGALLLATVVVLLLTVAITALYVWLVSLGADLPAGYRVDVMGLIEGHGSPSETDVEVMLYRAACAFVVLTALYLLGMVALLSNSYAVLLSTHVYLWLGREGNEKPTYPKRQTRHHRLLQLLSTIGALLFLAFVSLIVGVAFELIVLSDEPVAIVAHRLGGSSAPENSLEGLESAIDQGCYGAETDVQRTKDGHYIISHDDTFKRLTGVDRRPQDMTLAEIGELRVTDPSYPDEHLMVPTIEELLDASKGRIKLFIEFKGATADRQMVDDIVRIVRERDAVDDVALISLDYDVIAYAEETYPEFETGVLFFAGFGDLSLLECDMLIMEEEMSCDAIIEQVHDAGRQTGVWTVNTYDSMYAFLNSDADAVITDELALASDVQRELDERSDLKAIIDYLLR